MLIHPVLLRAPSTLLRRLRRPVERLNDVRDLCVKTFVSTCDLRTSNAQRVHTHFMNDVFVDAVWWVLATLGFVNAVIPKMSASAQL
jgi:hypothetical protein